MNTTIEKLNAIKEKRRAARSVGSAGGFDEAENDGKKQGKL